MVLTFLRCLWFGCAAALSFAKAQNKPHIIMIVVDDLGWADVGFRNNSYVQSPWLNNLAANGHVLSNYYVQATCSPTRACFLTGRLPLHTGVGTPTKSNVAIGMSLREVTVAQQLRSQGYRAHAVGKWHVGMMSFNHTPTFRGFESFYGFYGGSENYYTHGATEYKRRGGKKNIIDFRRDASEFCGIGCSEVPVRDIGQYSTDLFTREAINLISSHDVSTPLFLYLAYQAVHGPISPPKQLQQRYVDTLPDEPARRKYAAVLSGVDDGVGRISAVLRKRGMYENTFLVVTTDNGGSIHHGSNNAPLSGGKGNIWEGGIRGTAIVRAPGLRNDGSEFQGLAHAVDWMPTLARAAGGNTISAVDGFDLWPALRGVAGAAMRDHVYLGVAGRGQGYKGQKMRAIRQGSLKLVIRTGPDDDDDPERRPTRAEMRARKAHRQGASLAAVGRLWATLAGIHQVGGFLQQAPAVPQLEVFLYNVAVDPGEKLDLAAGRPDDVHRLLGLMASIRVDEVPLDMEVKYCQRAIRRVWVQLPHSKRGVAIQPACDLRGVSLNAVAF